MRFAILFSAMLICFAIDPDLTIPPDFDKWMKTILIIFIGADIFELLK